MTIKLNNTKILYRKSLTINEILYPNFKTIKDEEKVKYENDINLYRDIFRFIFSDYELKIGEDIRKVKVEEVTFIDSFKLWPLCKWLLANNRELIDEFKDNRTPIAYRSHLIQGRIALRLEKLRILGLFNIDEKKVKQTRNREQKTDLYNIEKNGLLVALNLQLQNSTRIQKISKKYCD